MGDKLFIARMEKQASHLRGNLLLLIKMASLCQCPATELTLAREAGKYSSRLPGDIDRLLEFPWVSLLISVQSTPRLDKLQMWKYAHCADNTF